MENGPTIDFFCASCGQKLTAPQELFGETTACPGCNTHLVVPVPREASPTGPEAVSVPPLTLPSDGGASTGVPALWNPTAAINWSVLFSPAFGAFIHARNAKALGRHAEEKANMRWFYAVLVFMMALSVACVIHDVGTPSLPLILVLIFWYFLRARKQMKFVKQEFAGKYPKKPWGKALLSALGGLAAFAAVVLVITTVIESVGASDEDGRAAALVAARQIYDESDFKVTFDSEGLKFLSSEVVAEDPPRYQVMVEVGLDKNVPNDIAALTIAVELKDNDEFIYFGPDLCGSVQALRDGDVGIKGLLAAQRVLAGWPGAEDDKDYKRKMLDPHNNEQTEEKIPEQSNRRPDKGSVAAPVASSSVADSEEVSEEEDPEVNSGEGDPLADSEEVAEEESVTDARKKSAITKTAVASGGEAATDVQQETSPAVVGPSEAVVKAGLDQLNSDFTRKPFRRGDTLVSRGANGINAGTLIYPIKAADLPIPIYFFQDEFQTWIVGLKDTRYSEIYSLRPGGMNKAAPKDTAGTAAELVEVTAKITSERKRWAEATALINKLTNNKRTPVQEGTQAYYRCLEASKIIEEVENGAAELKEEKTRLEAQLEN